MIHEAKKGSNDTSKKLTIKCPSIQPNICSQKREKYLHL